jgi:predicted site-specific integrase-resolvase
MSTDAMPTVTAAVPEPDECLLTAEELSARVKIAAAKLKQWARRGRIPSVRFSQKNVRFRLKDVIEAVESRAS